MKNFVLAFTLPLAFFLVSVSAKAQDVCESNEAMSVARGGNPICLSTTAVNGRDVLAQVGANRTDVDLNDQWPFDLQAEVATHYLVAALEKGALNSIQVKDISLALKNLYKVVRLVKKDFRDQPDATHRPRKKKLDKIAPLISNSIAFLLQFNQSDSWGKVQKKMKKSDRAVVVSNLKMARDLFSGAYEVPSCVKPYQDRLQKLTRFGLIAPWLPSILGGAAVGTAAGGIAMALGPQFPAWMVKLLGSKLSTAALATIAPAAGLVAGGVALVGLLSYESVILVKALRTASGLKLLLAAHQGEMPEAFVTKMQGDLAGLKIEGMADKDAATKILSEAIVNLDQEGLLCNGAMKKTKRLSLKERDLYATADDIAKYLVKNPESLTRRAKPRGIPEILQLAVNMEGQQVSPITIYDLEPTLNKNLQVRLVNKEGWLPAYFVKNIAAKMLANPASKATIVVQNVDLSNRGDWDHDTVENELAVGDKIFRLALDGVSLEESKENGILADFKSLELVRNQGTPRRTPEASVDSENEKRRTIRLGYRLEKSNVVMADNKNPCSTPAPTMSAETKRFHRQLSYLVATGSLMKPGVQFEMVSEIHGANYWYEVRTVTAMDANGGLTPMVQFNNCHPEKRQVNPMLLDIAGY